MVFRTNIRNQKYGRLEFEARCLARIPRYSRLLSEGPTLARALADDSATLAYIFYEAYHYLAPRNTDHTGLLDTGLRGDPAKFLGIHDRLKPPACNEELRRRQVKLASKILGAIAFEMFFPSPGPVVDPNDPFAEPEPAANATGPRFRIDGTEQVDAFYVNVQNRLLKSKAYWLENPNEVHGPKWTQDLESIRSMNSRGLEHFILDGGESSIRFTDITVQAFFAAVWATSYMHGDDLDAVLRSVPDPWLSYAKDCDPKKVYTEFWRFAAQMPAEHVHAKRWESMFAPLYDCQLSRHLQCADSTPIRSTELIYRTWDRMHNTQAGIVFQSEFQQILCGAQSDARQRVAANLLRTGQEENFLTLCEGRCERDDGRFRMGSDAGHGDEQPVHTVTLSHYRLHRYCVTNNEFELFEPRRKRKRYLADAANFRGMDFSRHPVVNVSWYDAVVFALWIGHTQADDGRQYALTLPTEAQWEYACRAGQQTEYTWNAGRDGDKIDKSYCNYGDWEFKPNNSKNIRARTVEVDGSDPGGPQLPVNLWGFSQMHGNVWEWCRDWYDQHYYETCVDEEFSENPMGPQKAIRRVLRGGSWIYGGVFCRSALRDGNVPSFRYWYVGFRLAAVPLSPGGHVGKIP